MIRHLCAAAVLTATLCRGQQTERTPLDEAGSLVEVTSIFSATPPSGYAPLRVKVTNNGSAPRTVTLRVESRAEVTYSNGSHQLDSSFSFTAPPGKTTEQEYMVPVCADVTPSSYGGGNGLAVRMEAGGRNAFMGFNGMGRQDWPCTAFSQALAARSLQDLNNAARGGVSSGYSSGGNFASLFTAPMLPGDWKGYSGLDILAITAGEWTGLTPAAKTAILQWVKLGGLLEVHRQPADPDLAALGIKPGDGRWLGTGQVREQEWDGRELSGSEAMRYSAVPGAASPRLSLYIDSLRQRDPQSGGGTNDYRPFLSDRPALVAALGEKGFAVWQVGIILVIFGLLVGPVNLFYFARAGRRHRLFFTTPIISLGAAAVLLFVIFFQDGTGGKGHRTSLVYVDAAENAAFIRQMQVSRTGVLFGGNFTTADAAVISPAVLPESRWTRLKAANTRGYRVSSGEAQRYFTEDRTYGGDWFQSRSEQGQFIDCVQSTRGRLEMKPGSGAPVVTSTFAAPLERVFYKDADGNYWCSPGEVTTGSSVTLLSSSAQDFTVWLASAASLLPTEMRESFTGAPAQNQHFYATSSGIGLVDTLGSIDWESSRAVLFGPLVP